MKVPCGQAFRRIRGVLNLSREEFAEEVGCPASTVSDIENDLREPSDAVLTAVNSLAGIDPYILQWVLFGDESKLPPGVVAAALKLREVWEQEAADWFAARS